MARISRADYDAMRVQVESGKLTVPQAAEQWGCSEQAVKRKATRDGWCVKRDAMSTIVRKMSTEKAVNEIANVAGRVARTLAEEQEREFEDSLKVGRNVRVQMNRLQAAESKAEEITPAMMRRAAYVQKVAAIGESAQRQLRTALGMTTGIMEHKGELQVAQQWTNEQLTEFARAALGKV